MRAVDSEKMSKSLGNFFTIRDVLARYHALALRWFLVATHYRAPVSYSLRGLDEARARLHPDAAQSSPWRARRAHAGSRSHLREAGVSSCTAAG
jgi:cysteinyl-tRNA synthetase